MFLTFKRFVLRFPVTVKYSQLRMPKKKAPQHSWPIASLCGVKLSVISAWKTEIGSARCCFVAGSASMYPEI